MIKRHERRWYYDRGSLVEMPLYSFCNRCKQKFQLVVDQSALTQDERETCTHIERCHRCADSTLYTADELDEAGKPVSFR